MSEKKRISVATLVMGVGTGASRIAGLVRDMVVAGMFGAGFGTDAFFMAFTVPNLLRRFFAEGSLTAAFVPTFSQVQYRQGTEEARRVADICWTLLILVMAAVTLLGILAAPVIVQMIGAGFGAVPGKIELTVFLTRLMFPYIFFVSLLALIAGILNVLGHYFWPSFSTTLLNICIILGAIFLAPLFPVRPVAALAVGVLLGGLLQLIVQFPVLRRKGFRLRFNVEFSHPVVRKIATLMLPGLAGVAIYQINVVVSRLLASFLREGSVSYLYYGQRLFELPQGIFIVSLAQAVLPAMSRQAADKDDEGVKDSLRFSLKLIVLVSLPAAAGLMVCAIPVYSLFFMRGEFVYQDVVQTALALCAYAPGLLFVGMSRVLAPTFFALQDTRTPVWAAFWTLLANALLGLLLMRPLGHVGLALALTLASFCNCVLLIWLLRKKIGSLGLSAVGVTLLRILPATLIMALAAFGILLAVDWQSHGAVVEKGLALTAAVAGGGIIYVGVGLLCGVKELRDGLTMIRRKCVR